MASSDTKSDFSAVSQANNHLALNLYKVLGKEDGNLFFSPFSVSTALAMLFCGTHDATSREMRSVLGYDAVGIKDDELKLCYQQLLAAIEAQQDSYTLACANSALVDKEFSVKDGFRAHLEDYFKASFLEVDFMNESAKAVQEINEWVKEKTKDMIPKLLDSLDQNTVMVLLNAIYFKGFWKNKFDKQNTFLQSFYNKGIESDGKSVDMMHLKEEFPYVEKESFKAIQLPYKGNISMLLLLPNARDGLEQLEKSLEPGFIEDLKKTMYERKVNVSLPKFRLEYSKSLKNPFQDLGMQRLFNRGAHFGGISDSENLLVSDIVHKAVVEVNEEGSEAAAATAVVMMLCSIVIEPDFIADHPFMFVIYNNENNLILFMGRVNEL